METKQNMANCESMATTVTLKDFQEYHQEPPPAYLNPAKSTMVQVAKIGAYTLVAIAGMLSFAIVFSAWLSSNAACTASQNQIETLINPQMLRSLLNAGSEDLDSAESKLDRKKSPLDSDDDNSSSGEDVTLFKLPLELNLQEHMFEKNHRSHMNCIVEKKKAEEIVDEQPKTLPPLLGLGINMTTDPRYLHFTGEKIAISCDSGKEHMHMQPPPGAYAGGRGAFMPGPGSHFEGPPPPFPMNLLHAGSANGPIHVIGPIPLGVSPGGPHPDHSQGPPPHLIPIFFPQGPGGNSLGGPDDGPIFFPHPPPHQLQQLQHQIQLQQSQQPQLVQMGDSGEVRERALPHPIPVMPRQQFQHVIRPRSVDNNEPHHRMKRVACDCACKHPGSN